MEKSKTFLGLFRTREGTATSWSAARLSFSAKNFGMVRQEKTDGLKGASPFSTDMHDNTKT